MRLIVGLYSARFCVFWAITMVPRWIVWIDELKLAIFSRWRFGKTASWSEAVSIFLGVIILLCVPYTLRLIPILDPTIPFDCIDALKSVVPSGKIFNYREWGGPLEFEGYPNWKLHIDGRLYAYDKSLILEYNNAAFGLIPVEEIELKYKPDVFFLHSTFHEKLSVLLQHSLGWNRIYSNNYCEILTRNPNRAQEDLKLHK